MEDSPCPPETHDVVKEKHVNKIKANCIRNMYSIFGNTERLLHSVWEGQGKLERGDP